MNKQTVVVMVVVLAVGFGLGWWLKPVPESPATQVTPNEMVQAEKEKTTPLTEMEQVALDFFIAAHIYADHEKIQPLYNKQIHPKKYDLQQKPGTVYVGTAKTEDPDGEDQEAYIFHPISGYVYYIELTNESGAWKVYRDSRKSVGPGGDYTFEEFTQTERYQYLRVYEWKEAEAK